MLCKVQRIQLCGREQRISPCNCPVSHTLSAELSVRSAVELVEISHHTEAWGFGGEPMRSSTPPCLWLVKGPEIYMYSITNPSPSKIMSHFPPAPSKLWDLKTPMLCLCILVSGTCRSCLQAAKWGGRRVGSRWLWTGPVHWASESAPSNMRWLWVLRNEGSKIREYSLLWAQQLRIWCHCLDGESTLLTAPPVYRLIPRLLRPQVSGPLAVGHFLFFFNPFTPCSFLALFSAKWGRRVFSFLLNRICRRQPVSQGAALELSNAN